MITHIYLMLKSYEMKNNFKINTFVLLCALSFSCIHASEFDQEQNFYEKLCMKDADYSDEQVQVYYKKIDPVVSTPQDGPDSWSFLHAVITENNEEIKILPTSDGTYQYQDISFKINNSEKFDPNQDMTISVMNGTDTGAQRCFKGFESKKPFLPSFENYNDLLTSRFKNESFLQQKLKLNATLRNSYSKPHKVTIEIVNGKKNPILVQGMAVVYNKNTEKTEIFFDFTDLLGLSIDHFDSVFVCKHKKTDIAKKIFCIHDHQLFEYDTKDVIGFFDVPKNRKQWIPDETGFYDLKQQCIVACLPSCYFDSCPETPQEPLVWVFGNDQEHDSFYELDSPQTIEDVNDYIYSSGDGSLYATLRHTTKAKEYLTENHTIVLDCLSAVMTPSLMTNQNVAIAGGHRSWPVGMYKKTQGVNTILWQRIEASQASEVEQCIHQNFNNSDLNCAFVAKWPNIEEEITAQESKQWCNAAQRFSDCFDARINHCDQNILNGFKTWNRLTHLNISNLRLDDTIISMPMVLQTISSMGQLTKFDFSNNSPIVTCNENYQELANQSSTTFCALAACLDTFKNLKELRIQGLWLKPHALLGTGMQNGVSQEIAILTGIINHKNRQGITAIMNSISKLSDLENLSMDGIPSSGSSFVDRLDRHSNLPSHFVAMCFLMTFAYSPLIIAAAIPIVVTPGMIIYYDGHLQSVNLKELSIKSAICLANKPSLKIINVYSPGSDCADYFSKTFKEELAKPQPDRIQTLSILSSTLD